MAEGNRGITTACIGLGSNVGDRAGYIDKALKSLADADEIWVTAVSEIIQTPPLGKKEQGDYLNAVAMIKTDVSAERLFERLVSIENSLGRVRGEKWAPRTIDLDLLLYGDEVIQRSNLTVPHSRMHLRSFVIAGMCQVGAEMMHPVLKRSMAELAGRLGGRDFMLDGRRAQVVSVAGIIGVGKTTLAKGLAEALGCAMLAEAYDSNPYIAEVYAGKQELALDSQLYFLDSRVRQLNKETLAPGVAVVSDYVCAKEMIYAKRTLTAEQLAVYEKYHSAAKGILAKPVLVIYLKDSPAASLERIHRRNRPYEQQIALATLEEFAADYENLFANWHLSPVIRVDVSEFNCTDAGEVQELADEVKHYIWRP